MKDNGDRPAAILKAGVEAGAVQTRTISIAIVADADGDVGMAVVAEKAVPAHLMKLILAKAARIADEQRADLRARIEIASDT